MQNIANLGLVTIIKGNDDSAGLSQCLWNSFCV